MELAVFADCRVLIKNFARQKDERFETFCRSWKKMRFQHIYTAQSTTVEILQTTAAIYHIAKRFLLNGGELRATKNSSGKQLLLRIGGLYLMYAIYFKQPTEQYMKIQLTLVEWKCLKEFVLAALPLETHAASQVQYIFWKLWQSNAFRFTITPEHIGLEQLVNYDDLQAAEESKQHINSKTTKDIEDLKDNLQSFSNIKDTLAGLTTLEDGYNEMKKVLIRQCGITQQALPATKIFANIASNLQHIQNIIEEKPLKEDAEGKQQGQNTRRQLKEKGYKLHHEDYSDCNELEDDDNQPSTSKTRRSLRRMSARTVFAETLTSQLLNELDNDSELNESSQCEDSVGDMTDEGDEEGLGKSLASLIEQE